MATPELKSVERAPAIFFDGTLAAGAGQTLFAALGLAQTPVYPAHGNRRITGAIYLSAVPSSAPVLSMNVDGSNTFDINITLQRDTSQSDFVYVFDIPLFMPYWTLQLTGNAAGSSCRVSVWTYPDGSGAAVSSSGGSTPTPTPASSTYRVAAFNAIGANTIIPAAVGQTIRIFHYTLLNNGAAATALILQDGATAISGAMTVQPTAGLSFDAPGGNYPLTLTAGNAFIIDNSAGMQVNGFVLYTQG